MEIIFIFYLLCNITSLQIFVTKIFYNNVLYLHRIQDTCLLNNLFHPPTLMLSTWIMNISRCLKKRNSSMTTWQGLQILNNKYTLFYARNNHDLNFTYIYLLLKRRVDNVSECIGQNCIKF